MNKTTVVKKILGKHYKKLPKNQTATAFAPTNIALCKYWGKRNVALNLPTTSSLSVTLPTKGTMTQIRIQEAGSKKQASALSSFDFIQLNGKEINSDNPFAQRLSSFLDLFRPNPNFKFIIETTNNIPTKAGFASSASGFAAIILALDQLFGWKLSKKNLSILARLGSGSASRSFWPGFVKWQKGKRIDGMDCYAKPLPDQWPELCIGLLLVSIEEKPLSSKEAMQRTLKTSNFYTTFVQQSEKDIKMMQKAITQHNFPTLGKIAESNALAMHASMLMAKPSIQYTLPKTLEMMQKVRRLRQEGKEIYFTQDAGPNLKLLFETKNTEFFQKIFSDMEILMPFG